MKLKYTTTIVLFLSVISLGFAQCLSDNFNTSYGNWTDSNTYRQVSAGSEGIGVGFRAIDNYIITNVALTNPERIQFLLARSSSSNTRTLSIQYSTTTTGIWTEARNITVNEVTETHQQFSTDLNLPGDYYIRVIMTQRSGGSYYLDDVSIFCGGSNAPELQLLDEFGNLQNCGFAVNFNSSAINDTVEKTIRIKNTGDVDLDITNITTTSNYTIVAPSVPITLSPNEETPLTITFIPNSIGTINGELHILNSDNNENDCIISLTGQGFAPAPEIDIEKSTAASIPSGSESNTGYDTVFASTAIGQSSSTKTYFIHNEGQLDLSIYDVTSSNPSEFQIISNPSNSTITSQTKIEFHILFTPQSSGIRTSIITINNNDADENPYTFEVHGTGTCSTTTLLAAPNNGPPGTTVTIVAANFGPLTTANLSGISAETKLISDTVIEVTIPENIASGSLTIINEFGCSNVTNFNLISSIATNCDGNNGYTPSDLFISEITDHPSGSHSYIEIFNGTGTAAQMDNYSIQIHYNATTIRTIEFEDITLNNQDVFVVTFGAQDAEDNNSTHGYDHVSNLVGINNNDNIRLLHNEIWIDLWGDISGLPFTVSPKGYTYRRKNNIQNTPSTAWNQDDWESFQTVDYTDIGAYNFSSGIPPQILKQPPNSTSSCSLFAQLSTTADEGFIGQKQLQYQWFYNPPESNSWTAVVDDEHHENSQTSILKILNTLQVNGNQYYCRVLEDSELCYKATNATKIFMNESIWTSSGWVNNIEPDETSFTQINSNYNTLTHGNLTTCGLYIPIGKTLIIEEDSFVSVADELNVEGELIVKNKGSFVQNTNSEIINSGNITVEKETAILNAWYEYTYWSSPVSNEIFNNVFSNSSRLFWYEASNFADIYKEENNNNAQELGQDDVDDNANDWQAIGESKTIKGTDYLIPGVGYAATHSNTNFTVGERYTYSFSGDFNNGTILTPVERNDESNLDSNWNLIGNPYPSAIDVTKFFDANVNVINSGGVLEGVIYLWSHDTPPSNTFNGNELLNFSPSDYAIINASGSISAQEGEGTKPDNFIPSCQGFFVKFSDNYPTSNGHVIFNNDMRVTANNTQFFKTIEHNKFWINLTSDNGVFSQILVSYVPGAKDEYDGSLFDIETHISKDVSAKLFSSIADSDKKLIIQGKDIHSINQEEKINLGFHLSIKTPTIYSISLDDFEGSFITENELILEDTFLNTYHDLKASDYNFTSEPGTFTDRFNLTFKSPALTVETFNEAALFQIIQLSTNDILFDLDSDHIQLQVIEIYNLLGQKIQHLEPQINREIFNASLLSSGTYITSITCSNSINFKRKFIKK